jgi:hypothetical protein
MPKLHAKDGIYAHHNTKKAGIKQRYCDIISLMPKNRIILVLGVLIALLPLLGFPGSWEAFFQVLAGLSIVVLSVWSSIDKKLMHKAKAQQRTARKFSSPTPEASEVLESNSDNESNKAAPVPGGKRVTDFYPKTAPPGRRLSDIKPTLNPDDQEF